MLEADVVICPVDLLEAKNYMARVTRAATGSTGKEFDVPKVPSNTGQVEKSGAEGVWTPGELYFCRILYSSLYYLKHSISHTLLCHIVLHTKLQQRARILTVEQTMLTTKSEGTKQHTSHICITIISINFARNHSKDTRKVSGLEQSIDVKISCCSFEK